VPGLPNCSSMKAVRAFETLGYERGRQNGRYVRLKCPGRIPLTVPIHHGSSLAEDTLLKLIDKSGFTVEDFEGAL
jgi:predicted RNA binding protein YcfA (HicA-like mRNA interferase family)